MVCVVGIPFLLIGSNDQGGVDGFVVPSSSSSFITPTTTASRNPILQERTRQQHRKEDIVHSELVSPLQHMGHSHSHHHHHDHSEKGEQPKLSSKAKRQRIRRRIALWVFCWLATCLPPLIKRRYLKSQDMLAFVVSCIGIGSFDKIRLGFLEYSDKIKGFRDGIIKHSGGGVPPPESQSSSSRLYSKQLRYQDTTAADRVTWIGVFVNLLLSGGKLFIGIIAHSSALIADAGHSLSDLFSDFITLWSVRVARLPPDDDHPYGHSKFESLGSLFLSFTLLATGVGVGAMANKQLIQLLSGKVAKEAVRLPGPLALVMAGISIASKEWLYRITKVVGERLNSPVVIANAWHHRSDAYSSVLALLSIAWAMTGFPAADAAAGMLVAGMICMTGADILSESISQLSDSADMELQEKVSELVDNHVARDDDVLESTSVRARQVGSSAIVDVTVETSPQLSTTATRAVERRLKSSLKRQFQNSGRFLTTATVHAKPKLLSCPLLEEQQNQQMYNADSSDGDESSSLNNGDVFLTASSIEDLVRQHALLMELPSYTNNNSGQPQPVTTEIKDVTVHYSQQHQTMVDVVVVSNSESLPELQLYAKSLKSSLELLSEIGTANIYFELDTDNIVMPESANDDKADEDTVESNANESTLELSTTLTTSTNTTATVVG